MPPRCSQNRQIRRRGEHGGFFFFAIPWCLLCSTLTAAWWFDIAESQVSAGPPTEFCRILVRTRRVPCAPEAAYARMGFAVCCMRRPSCRQLCSFQRNEYHDCLEDPLLNQRRTFETKSPWKLEASGAWLGKHLSRFLIIRCTCITFSASRSKAILSRP